MYVITNPDQSITRFAHSAEGMECMVQEVCAATGHMALVGSMEMEIVEYATVTTVEGEPCETILARCLCGGEHDGGEEYFAYGAGLMMPTGYSEETLKHGRNWFHATSAAQEKMALDPRKSESEVLADALMDLFDFHELD